MNYKKIFSILVVNFWIIIFILINFKFVLASNSSGVPIREINLQNIALNKCEQYLKTNRIELAVKSFEEALKFEQAVLHNPNFKRVKEIFEKRLKEYIKELTDKGNRLFLEKKYEECKKIFQKVLEVDPNNAQAKDKIQVCNEQLKLLERKREVYHDPTITVKTLEKWDQNKQREMLTLALNLIKKKEFEEALKVLNECKSKNISNPFIDDKIKHIQKLISIKNKVKELSILSTNLKTNDDRIQNLILNLDSEDKDFKLREQALNEKELSNHIFLIANYYVNKGLGYDAESIINRYVLIGGLSDDITFLLAKIFYDRKEYYKSFKMFKTLRIKNLGGELKTKANGYYYELMFRIYKFLILTILIQLTITITMGIKAYPIVDYAFDGVLTRILTLKFYDFNYYYTNGMSSFNKGYFEKAINYFTKALAFENNNPSLYYTLGLCYYKTKNYEAARSAFESALKLSPNYQRAAYYLALIYDYNKMQKEAIHMLEIAKGIQITNRNFTMVEIDKNKALYVKVFAEYKQSVDKILNLNEPILT